MRLRYAFLNTCFEREGLWLSFSGGRLPMVGGEMWGHAGGCWWSEGGGFGGYGGCRRW